jgi:uncharacterized protein with FMN-binding domain
VALSSAAVLTVYSAGYLRTRAAADRLQAADRGRVVIPEEPGDWSGAHAGPREEPRADTAQIPAVSSTPASSDGPARRLSTSGGAAHAVGTETPVARTVDPVQPVTSVAPTPVPETSVPVTPVPTTTVAVAPAVTPAPEPTPTPAPEPRYKDGTYSGWGTSRHGDIEATVVIANGKITSAQITQCWTRYSCSWVAHLQGQVVERQSPEVDYVSGATQSTNAFYYAVVQALSKAK